MKNKLIILLLFCVSNVFAQNETSTYNVQCLVDICLRMRDAISINNKEEMLKVADEFKLCDPKSFSNLKCIDDTTVVSFNGHFIYDDAFVKAYAEDAKMIEKTDSIYKKTEESKVRGQSPSGRLKIKNCFVKAKESTHFVFTAKGRLDIAVIAENGGFVTMKIHVLNSAGLDEIYDDNTNVILGEPYRQASFDLPLEYRNVVQLEIINCGNNDCSFAVIRN